MRSAKILITFIIRRGQFHPPDVKLSNMLSNIQSFVQCFWLVWERLLVEKFIWNVCNRYNIWYLSWFDHAFALILISRWLQVHCLYVRMQKTGDANREKSIWTSVEKQNKPKRCVVRYWSSVMVCAVFRFSKEVQA